VFGTTIALWFLPLHSAHQMRRLLDVSRLSGGSYPRMVEDGLDPIAPVRCVLYTGFHTTPSAW
jgi:palmitoyltransferase